MAYVKNIWVDQDVERPKTYEVTNNQDGSITLTDSFGLVTELGTPVNETNMNHIEDGIEGCAIRKYNLTETFNLGEWVLGGTGGDEGIYKSLVSNNVGNAITDDTKWEKVEMGGGASRNVGEIVPSIVPLIDAGLHLLDGSLLSYGSYQDFIDYIADLYDSGDYPDLFETEANWQQSVTTYGVCGKFVYDDVNNTVRLPKITGKIDGTTDLTALGDLVQQYVKLPNITGSFPAELGNASTTDRALGAFYNMGVTRSGGGGEGTDWATGFDASLVSSVYSGNGSDTQIHEQAINVLYYIVIATSTKTEIEVDIDDIATDLNGKADVDGTNMIASVKNFDGQWVESFLVVADNVTYPTTADIDYDLSSYLPNDNYNYEVIIGIRVITGSTSGNVVWARIYTDLMTGSAQVAYAQTRTSSNVGAASSIILPVGSGRSVSVYRNSGNVGTFTLYVNGYRRIGTNQ